MGGLGDWWSVKRQVATTALVLLAGLQTILGLECAPDDFPGAKHSVPNCADLLHQVC